MARFWITLLAWLSVAALASAEVRACRPQPATEALYEIADALQRHVATPATTEPQMLRLNEFMRPEQLTGDQVHCSDFGLEYVTATKRGWVFDIIYRPHLVGQPGASRARVTVIPFANAAGPSVEKSGDAPPLSYAKSPWSSNPAWDGQFRVRNREKIFVGVSAMLALPVGLTAGLIFAVWLARLRRNAARKGAPSPGFMFALGSTLFVLILGTLATPASSPIHWTLVAFLLPSTAVVSAGIVQLMFDRVHQLALHAIGAGEEDSTTLDSAGRIGMKTTIDNVAEGYRMSWSTHRSAH